MEEDLYLKILFLRNLHPGLSQHLGVMACPRTMSTQQLKDFAHKAYSKQKMAAEKGTRAPAICDFNTQDQGLALEGATHYSRNVSCNEPRENFFAREQDSHANARPKQPTNRLDRPREQAFTPGRYREKPWNQSSPHEGRWGNSRDQPRSYGNAKEKGAWEDSWRFKGERQTAPEAVSPKNRR